MLCSWVVAASIFDDSYTRFCRRRFHISRGGGVFSVILPLPRPARSRHLPCEALSLDLLLHLVLDLLGLVLDLLHHLGDLVAGAAGEQDAADLDDTHEAEEEVDGGEAVLFICQWMRDTKKIFLPSKGGAMRRRRNERTGSSWA